MRYVFIGIAVLILVILVTTGGRFINSSSQALPTPTPIQPSQEALNVAAVAVVNATTADRKTLQERYGDLSDKEYTYQLALDLTKNPTELALVEANEAKMNKQNVQQSAPVIVNQPIQMPQYNPPAMVSAPRPVTCHQFYNGDVSCY